MNIGIAQAPEVDHGRSSPPREFTIARGSEMAFGRFVAAPASRTLMLDGKAVCIGARAYDLLMLLLESSGEVVSKEAIMRYVWPTTTVDECNLRFQMTSLRRVLGEERDRIKTITGRGYLFVAEQGHAWPAGALSENVQHTSYTAGRLGKPKIVIIDENPENREALQRLLRPFDADVKSYASMDALFQYSLHS